MSIFSGMAESFIAVKIYKFCCEATKKACVSTLIHERYMLYKQRSENSGSVKIYIQLINIQILGENLSTPE